MPDYPQLAAAMMPADATQFSYPSLVDALAATHPAPDPNWLERQRQAIAPYVQPITDFENQLWQNYAPQDTQRLAHAFMEAPRLNPAVDIPLSLNEGIENLDNLQRRADAARSLGIAPQQQDPGFWPSVWDMMSGNSGLPLPLLGAIKAYHGSAHDFDAFNMSKIGTGDGKPLYALGGDREIPLQAAVNVNGKIFTGENHDSAWKSAGVPLTKSARTHIGRMSEPVDKSNSVEGFVTNSGRFVDRQEAYNLLHNYTNPVPGMPGPELDAALLRRWLSTNHNPNDITGKK